MIINEVMLFNFTAFNTFLEIYRIVVCKQNQLVSLICSLQVPNISLDDLLSYHRTRLETLLH